MESDTERGKAMVMQKEAICSAEENGPGSGLVLFSKVFVVAYTV